MGLLDKKAVAALCALTMAAGVLLTGCGQDEQGGAPKKVAVKAMKALKQDVTVNYGYPGQLKSLNEVEVHSRISGSIMEKYFKGGSEIHAGDPLYRLDSRQYESAVIEAQGNLHKAEADLRNAQEDLARDEMLWRNNAISEQELTNKQADVDGYMATVETYQASVQKARENLDDTMVYAPMDGWASLDDVAVGAYATAGSTKLVTIGTLDPIYAQFSISESEYLDVLSKVMENGTLGDREYSTLPKVKLTLSNGQEYPLTGEIVAADKGFSDNSVSLTIKAEVPNPYGALLSGMFARVSLLGTVAKGVILVPQRSVQQLLDETFVLVVGSDGKSVSKKVVLGEKVGSYYIVKQGITTDDTVIVDGLTSLQPGQELDVTMVTAADMGFSTEESKDIVDKS